MSGPIKSSQTNIDPFFKFSTLLTVVLPSVTPIAAKPKRVWGTLNETVSKMVKWYL